MPEEKAFFRDVAEQLADALGQAVHVVLAGVESRSERVRSLSHWPLVELLRGVDVLVGAGGYHTVQEARAAGVPLVALPQRRLYDRQERRLHEHETADSGSLAARVRACLQAKSTPAHEPRSWPRGAEQGLQAIERSLLRGRP
jgi:UDP:flavonoid glycosyltransferase YjiC (YdhE family)